MIKLTQLAAEQSGQTVFSELNLTLQSGDVVSLLGPNGCGKTTLLRTVLGLHPRLQGAISIDGQALEQLSPKAQAKLISYVPQYHRLAFGYPVLEMVLMGVMAGHSEWVRPSRQQKAVAQNALAQLNIQHLSTKPYTELSGGQRQLVLIARALAQNTPYLFLDEPTNGLDYGNQIKLLDLLKTLAADHRCILMTTHHPEHALAIANRVILMQNGHLLADGTPKEVIQPSHLAQLYGLKESQVAHFKAGC